MRAVSESHVETDLIQLVFCHPADAGVVVGGPVVRRWTILQTQTRCRPAVSADIQAAEMSSEEKSTWEEYDNVWLRCLLTLDA